MEVIINGIRYVPETTVQPDPNPNVAQAVHDAVSAIYLAEWHKARAHFWDILNALDPQMAELVEQDPGAALDACNKRVEAARTALEEREGEQP